MISPRSLKRIHASEKDHRTLRQILDARSLSQAEQPGDYRKKIVKKPWGYEFLVFENRLVAVWFLHIERDHSTSMHCHPTKRTALSVLSGKALCNTFNKRNFLSAGDAINLDAGVFHSTKAISLDSVLLLETESPNRKSDLVRLDDAYGRQGGGYEGVTHMTSDRLEEYRHFSFHVGDSLWSVGGDPYTSREQFSISFEGYPGPTAFREEFIADE